MPTNKQPMAAGPNLALSPTEKLRLPELLSPAGDWDCAKAAVENGADAIYFGLERHNARMRANNFSTADLPRLMAFLHRRGVKGYLTFNTLVFPEEMAEARDWLREIIAAGVDAAVVQDVGICRLIRRLSPDFPIHASTQMTITSAAGMEFARDLGCNVVVLARECSIAEIKKIRSVQIGSAPLPLEVFVHGALCVAYSGQCLTSESLGGRSANRGVCAQACRMPFDLIADGQLVPLGDRRYLLSPRDLAGLELLPELIRAGVSSLKIEGRLKSPEYVANITRIYREALDKVAEQLAATADASTASHPSPEVRYRMEMAFSRGLHTGWMRGVNNQELVHARFGKKRGIYLGEVLRVQGEAVWITLEKPALGRADLQVCLAGENASKSGSDTVVASHPPLKPGDGIVFDAGRPDEKEEGGRVYEVQINAGKNGEQARLAFRYGHLDFRRVHPGDKVWKTSDPELDRQLRQTFAGESPRFQRPIDFEVSGRIGAPLELKLRDELGNAVAVASAIPLEPARHQPLTSEQLRKQLGRTGGTPFQLGRLDNHLEGEVMLPVSELNRLRREAVSQLEQLRAHLPRWTIQDNENQELEVHQPRDDKQHCNPQLVVLVRTLPQLESALRCGIERLYCELENPKKYREAVRHVRLAQGCGDPHPPPDGVSPSPTLYVAPPRIFKPGEDWILQQVLSSDADGYLVRNHDHLQYFADHPCVGDYSLNIANALSAEYFIEQFQLERITASYDLNVTQLEALLRSAPPEWFEVTIHQHMPMFHMEHCVFCACLSSGTDYTNCGRPCDKREVRLRDRVGAQHFLKADAGCRNTVFNALAQTGAEAVERLVACGVRHFRLEFMEETPEQVAQTISRYRQLLRGEITGTQLWRELKLFNQLGVTRGQMDKAGG